MHHTHPCVVELALGSKTKKGHQFQVLSQPQSSVICLNSKTEHNIYNTDVSCSQYYAVEKPVTKATLTVVLVCFDKMEHF